MRYNLFLTTIGLLFVTVNAFGGDVRSAVSAQSHAERASEFLKNGNNEGAIAEYNAAIKLDPDNAALYHNRALAGFNARKLDQAEADFDKAIQIEPQNAWFYNGRGGVSLVRGNTLRARQDFAKALSIDAANTVFRENFRKAGGVWVEPATTPRSPVSNRQPGPKPSAIYDRPFPTYDVEVHCNDLASLGGSYSYSMKNTCVDIEQEAYNKLLIQWSSLPVNITDHCQRLSTVTSGSYSLLETCISIELEEQSNRHFFRR